MVSRLPRAQIFISYKNSVEATENSWLCGNVSRESFNFYDRVFRLVIALQAKKNSVPFNKFLFFVHISYYKKKFSQCNKMFCCLGTRRKFDDKKYYISVTAIKNIRPNKNSIKQLRTIDCVETYFLQEFLNSYNQVFRPVAILYRQQKIKLHEPNCFFPCVNHITKQIPLIQ